MRPPAPGPQKDAMAVTRFRRRSPTPAVLTYLITLGFFGALAVMLLTDGERDAPSLMYMLSALQMAWAACIGYWFGTTQSSGEKTRLLGETIDAK